MAFGFLGGYLAGARANARAGRFNSVANSMSETALAKGDLADLDARIDRLGVVIAAMWSLLEDAGYSEEALEARIDELSQPVDLEGLLRCPSCGAGVRSGAGTCQICGTAVGDADPVHDL